MKKKILKFNEVPGHLNGDKIKRIEYIIESFDTNFLNMKDENEFYYDFGLLNNGSLLSVNGNDIFNREIVDEIKSNLHVVEVKKFLKSISTIRFYVYTNLDRLDNLDISDVNINEIEKNISQHKEYLNKIEETVDIIKTYMKRFEEYFKIEIYQFLAEFLEETNSDEEKFGFYIDVKI